MAHGLQHLGHTQQTLLRVLLQAPEGATIEDLCTALRVTHNAVRQHLSALLAAGLVMHGTARASGGRPRACYLLAPAGRDLFPRNYALISGKLLEHLFASAGAAPVGAMLATLGRELGQAAARPEGVVTDADAAAALAVQLDALGYEAQTVRQDGEVQLEAYNCVFHALARAHPEVCGFDIAFMEAASGRPVQHLECLMRGGRACRFRVGTDPTK